MKQYVTYTRKKISDNLYVDPNTGDAVNKESGGLIKLNETPYEIDGIFISWIEYGEQVTPETLEYFKNLDPSFEFTIVTEEQVNTLLSTLGDVSVQDFIFLDNRPEDID